MSQFFFWIRAISGSENPYYRPCKDALSALSAETFLLKQRAMQWPRERNRPMPWPRARALVHQFAMPPVIARRPMRRAPAPARRGRVPPAA
jgi:hypothetical protein